MSLTTLAAARSYLGLPAGFTADDARIATFIEEAEAIAVRVLNGRRLELASHVMTFDGNDGNELLLPHYPIASIDAVEASGTALGSDSFYFDDNPDSDYGALWLSRGVWPRGKRNIRVSWTGGFATVPHDVRRALNVIVADLYMRSKQLESGQQQNEMEHEGIHGGRQETYVSEHDEQWGIPRPAVKSLKRYRNPS